MKLLVASLWFALGAALVQPAASPAKGASEAVIRGPGLADPIELAGEGQPGGEQLMALAESLGFFPSVFGQSPDPMRDVQPQGRLGPRYTITWVMPGPNGEQDEIVQDLYPHARPQPVTYTEPGQRFWATERTRGGWFVAWSPQVRDQLVAAGLPPTPPRAGGGDDGMPWTALGALVLVAAAAGIAALTTLVLRRRPGPSATT